MRVRCIALYIDVLLYNPLCRLNIEILLYSATILLARASGCPAGADDRFG